MGASLDAGNSVNQTVIFQKTKKQIFLLGHTILVMPAVIARQSEMYQSSPYRAVKCCQLYEN